MRGGRLARVVLCVAAAACDSPSSSAPETAALADAASAGSAAGAPTPSFAGEGSLARVAARSDVPLTGYRVDARAGDWRLESEDQVAVVDARGGRVIDFGTSGHDDALVGIEPTVYLGLDDLRADVVDVAPVVDAPRILRIERRVRDLPVTLWTFVGFVGTALRVESVASSTSDGGTTTVTLGERASWGNVPTWVEGAGFVTRAGTFEADFIAREGLGQAYALGLEGARLVARFNAPEPGFHERARTGEATVQIRGSESTPRRAVWLTHAEGGLGDAVVALEQAQRLPLVPVTLPAATLDRARLEAAEGCGGPPFSRFALGAAPRSTLLPNRALCVRVAADGAAPGAWTGAGSAGTAPPAHAGRLHWRVTERGGATGATLPARIAVHGVAPTLDPDWGDDPHDGAALEAVVSLGEGEVSIPAGTYRVTVSRGFEYTQSEQTLHVDDGRTTALGATLERVVDTRGWISADLHVHAVPSPDAPTLLDDRVRSLAASGVEVAAATDHNAVTDYGPTIRSLGVERWLASIVGDEVTTRGTELGHFNVFPLAPDAPPVPYERTTPHDIFAAARASAPADRDKVVQVNHPRMGAIGYFELIHLDPSDFAAWRKRAPLFDPGFDALEVFNGDDYAEPEHVEACLRDWYALLDAGLRVTATGNSDSHKLTYHEAGVPRNYVRVPNDAPESFDERVFIDAVRHGRVVVSSGPFVRIQAGNGEHTADVGGEVPFDPAGINVHVQVDAPAWVDVTTIEIVCHGRVLSTWHPKTSGSGFHFDATERLPLQAGDWVIAVARGSKPMAFLHRPGALPLGFTNPIFVR
ncbi:MAG TPA: CehA/McbA family metallohydrolase [Polyangiaceae bacterium]|jgi:hypothetical protein|nr:CehA/McbA family metallohydrolase [Polyangiaceae bacterium]